MKISPGQFEDTIRNYGYLSAEARLRRASLNSKDNGDYVAGKELVRQAKQQLRRVKNAQVKDHHMVGLNLWVDAVETLQGALLLADRGITKAAMSTTRTGLELLLHACAYWKSLETAKMVSRSDEIALLRIQRTICKRYPELISGLDPVPEPSKEEATQEKQCTLNTGRIAELVSMEEFYFGMHKQLGFSGTHANANSMTPRITKNAGCTTLKNPAEPALLRAAFSAIVICLVECLTQFKQHFEPLLQKES